MTAVSRAIVRRALWIVPLLGAVAMFAQHMPGGGAAQIHAASAPNEHGVRVIRARNTGGPGNGLFGAVGDYATAMAPDMAMPANATADNGVRVHRHH